MNNLLQIVNFCITKTDLLIAGQLLGSSSVSSTILHHLHSLTLLLSHGNSQACVQGTEQKHKSAKRKIFIEKIKRNTHIFSIKRYIFSIFGVRKLLHPYPPPPPWRFLDTSLTVPNRVTFLISIYSLFTVQYELCLLCNLCLCLIFLSLVSVV